MTTAEPRTVAIIGGTGQQGGGLAVRLARAGHTVIVGSRDGARAAEAAANLNRGAGTTTITGTTSEAAIAAADLAILAVPFAGQMATALALQDALAGKVLIDATVPLVPPRVARVQLPEGGSAVAALQAALGPEVRVVSAFQNVSWQHLMDVDHAVDCDVLVCGDDAAACDETIALTADIGMRGFHAGPIVNSVAAEALTSLLISINRRYKSPGAGIRITGV